jgi:hypothetical protein
MATIAVTPCGSDPGSRTSTFTATAATSAESARRRSATKLEDTASAKVTSAAARRARSGVAASAARPANHVRLPRRARDPASVVTIAKPPTQNASANV